MDFGLALDLGSETHSLRARLDAVVPLLSAAEARGFSAVSFGEQHPTGPGYFHAPGPMLSLAALASQTGLTLCTGVTLLTSWSPLRLAYDAAVLDQLSEGRLILGVAAGGPATWKQFGRTKEGLSQWLDETLTAIKSLWAGEDGFHGEQVHIEHGIRPLPVQAGGPPLWLGGATPRAIRRAAALADGWYASTNYRLDREIEPQILRYKAEVAATGARRSDVVVNRLCVLAPTSGEALRIARTYVEPLLAVYASFGGLRDAAGEPLTRGDDLIAALRDEVALIGTPDEVAAQVERLAASGVTHLQLRVQPQDMPAELAGQTIELAGEELVPRFAAT